MRGEGMEKGRESGVESPHFFNRTITTGPHFQKPGSITGNHVSITERAEIPDCVAARRAVVRTRLSVVYSWLRRRQRPQEVTASCYQEHGPLDDFLRSLTRHTTDGTLTKQSVNYDYEF